MTKILLFAALILAIGWLVLRVMRGSNEQVESEAPRIQSTPYHAVSLQYSESACDAAKAMTGRRFLANAAPRLPLPECDSLDCRCRFLHHDDRRTGDDRRSPFAPARPTGSTGTFKIERRQNKDRRRSADPDGD